MIIKNAKIYTCNDKMPWAEAIAFKDDIITFVGSDKDLPENDQVFDAKGKTIFPSFVDSHNHPGMVSQSSWHIRLPWFDNVNDLLDFVKHYAQEHPKEEIPFLFFEYYPTTLFGEKGPTKELLDTAVSDRPCLCQDFGEHLHWVNSKMLECMGVTKDTPDPVPGLEMFVRDENGEPTGWVKEFAWLRFSEKLFANIDWEPPIKITPKRMENFFIYTKENGITALGDGLLEGEDQLISMFELDRQGKLNLYYDGIVRFWSIDDLPEKISELRLYQKKYTNKHIKLNSVKLFLDGTNEAGNSALLHPLSNDPTGTNYGEIKMETEELTRCFVLCNKEGVDLQIHMVGDRAFRVGCDAVEAAQKIASKEGTPWTIQPIFAHCELIDPDDFSRPAKLGITINWTCHWAGGYFGTQGIHFLGSERWHRMYRITELIKSGALIACSSDVTSFHELYRRANPLFGIQISNTRIDPEFPVDPELCPGSVRTPVNQKIPLEFLIKGYTLNAAKQLHYESIMGSLEVNKKANMNVFSQNPFCVDPMRVKDIGIEAVIFDGKVIHGEI
ncbi:MAG: amidohydrolase family protein [Clostridia bacterium]|nr:amidohydrolase family protein [Clostridia bacterium]